MFYILSQNREKLYNLNGHIEGIGYEETHVYKRTAKGERKEINVRHTICVFDGCAEEVAEYDTKEDCLKVVEMCAFTIQNNTSENAVYSMPTKEQLPDMVKTHEQLAGMYREAAEQASDGLKELFDILKEGGRL